MYIKNSNQVMCYYKNTENRGTREIASTTQEGEREHAFYTHSHSIYTLNTKTYIHMHYTGYFNKTIGSRTSNYYSRPYLIKIF